MSFLAPLYALAALAIVAPILFHLVRKRPKDVTEYSSVIFLDSVPPKFSNRNRLEHLGLLLLRVGAFGLLAFAFARPYLRLATDTNSEMQVLSERVLLIDTSASMRRAGIWEQVVEKAMRVIDEAKEDDLVGVYSMQEDLEPVLSLEAAKDLPVSQRRTAAISAVQSLSPTWGRSNVGVVLSQAAELFGQNEVLGGTAEDVSGGTQSEGRVLRTLYLVSDFPRDGTLESFRAGVWPEDVHLVPLVCEAAQSGNASAIILPVDGSSVDESEQVAQVDGEVRVMLSNSALSSIDRLQLQWLSGAGVPIPETKREYFVPPGRQQVVRFPLPTDRGEGVVGAVDSRGDGNSPVDSSVDSSVAWVLELSGDDQAFDNRRYHCVERSRRISVGMIDQASDVPENSLWYFAKRVPLSRSFEAVEWTLHEPTSVFDERVVRDSSWWVASHVLTFDQAKVFTKYLADGGHLFWVWDKPIDVAGDPSDMHQNKLEILREWFSQTHQLGEKVVTGGVAGGDQDSSIGIVRESVGDGFALLENLMFSHPVLVSFADSKFNDFSKIRFWNHRVFEPSASDNWSILARFDDGSPALLEASLGKGRVTILTSGWQTRESQFALSSKFVPILSGLFDQAVPMSKTEERVIGSEVDLSFEGGIVQTFGGEVLPQLGTHGVRFSEPGIYKWRSDGSKLVTEPGEQINRRSATAGRGNSENQIFAVNIDKRETRTDPMELEEFTRVGVVVDLANAKEKALVRSAGRQRLAEELESRQHGWWWMIAVVLVLATVESIWGVFRSSVTFSAIANGNVV
jgi:hypothetical protein